MQGNKEFLAYSLLLLAHCEPAGILSRDIQAIMTLLVFARWLANSDWHFRHLLGSLHMCLAHVLLLVMTNPSLIVQFSGPRDWNHAIRCADLSW